MDAPIRDRAAVDGLFPKARIGVSLLFLMNGFMVGSWAPKIPEFAERLRLSEGQLGLMILTFGIGSLIMMPVSGAQIARFGSMPVAKLLSVCLLPALVLVTYSHNVWFGAAAMLLFGGFTGAMDVAMNANAVEVEKAMRRSIMSSCHAFWSLGGLIGAGIGGFAIAHWGVGAHAILLTLLAAGMLAVAWPMILRDPPHHDEDKPRAKLPMTPLPWLIGIVALFCMVPEGAILDWGALYLRKELGASVTLSGFAFAAFSLTMAIMRFAGDLLRDRLGAVRTMRVSAVLGIVGMMMAGLAPDAAMVIVGFAIAGIGISNMVPIAFSAAGNMPGLAPGVGISLATSLGYSGMLFAPSLIGFIAEHTGFAPVFTVLPLLFIVVLVLSGLARHADSIK